VRKITLDSRYPGGYIGNVTIEEKRNLEIMLRRIGGQVNGISKMINDDKGCEAVMTQVMAAVSSLKSVGRTVLADATCNVPKEESTKLLKRFL